MPNNVRGTNMVKNVCPECESNNPDEATFCQNCGTNLRTDEKLDIKEPKEVKKLKKGKHWVTTGKISVYSEGLLHDNKFTKNSIKIPWDQILDVKYSRSQNKVYITTSDFKEHIFMGRLGLTMKSDVTKGIYLLTKEKMSGKVDAGVDLEYEKKKKKHLVKQELKEQILSPKAGDLKKRQRKFLDGLAKMTIEILSNGHSGATRAGATIALGIIGYAATKGDKAKKLDIFVKITEDKILISGGVNTEINIVDINNTMLSSKLTLNFNDGFL